MTKIIIFLLLGLTLSLSNSLVLGHDDSGPGPSCTPNNQAFEVCCPNEADFQFIPGGPNNVIGKCTRGPLFCRMKPDACSAAPLLGERCMTVFYDDCQNQCAYADDFLFCTVTGSGCGTGIARASGLISTSQLPSTSKFSTSAGVCVIDPKAAYAPFKIPTYNDLKSIYYGQSKAQKSTITTLSPVADKNVYLREGDLTISAGISGSGIALIFVDGNLIITSNLTYGAAPSNGLVFVVSGNVYIAQGVNRVNGVIISQGEICTASQGSPPTCPAGLTDGLSPSQSLVVVGSLINLDPAKPIRFRRNLTSNAGPAEQIVHQAKYLVLLRDIFSSTLQKWSEIP